MLAQVHAGERHVAFWATATVFLVLAAHGILETARDALFLSHLPASDLPWLYLAIAGLALLGTRHFGRSAGSGHDLRRLIAVQVAAAAGTLCFLGVTRAKPPWALYALYVWGGLAAMVILTRFWLLMSDWFTVSQAKRLFPVIAAGPLLGSLVGYGVAGLLSRHLRPSDLLGVSAAFFLLSVVGSLALWRARDLAAAELEGASAPEGAFTTAVAQPHVRDTVAMAIRHPYLRRVALLLLTASVTVTFGDFVFKSVVARAVDPERLDTFFAVTYFGFDVVALVLLLTAVGPLMRTRGVTEALALEPALLLVTGVLLTVVGGLGPVICLRGVDGALRWSLHKTATELLYVPLSTRLRVAVKGLSDIVAHRGGQALASLLILAWVALAPSDRLMGAVIAACAVTWILLAVSLREPYLDLFRETLSQTAIERGIEFPDLDLASLETLLAALSGPDEHKVIAAMELLEQSGRVRLIPALILYHPSPRVVTRALALFTAAGRDDFLPMMDLLLRHADAGVRAAMVRACAVVCPDAAMLERASRSESTSVAATAVVALAAHGRLAPEAALARLAPLVDGAGAFAEDVRPFIARALCDHPSPGLAPLLEPLVTTGDPATRREAVRAMGAVRDPRHLRLLVDLLAVRSLREAAREALLAFGQPGLDHLQTALLDLALPRAVRVHLPRTISRFGTQAAADMLLRHLLTEPSGAVRFKVLRGLGGLGASRPELHLEPHLVDEAIDRQLTTVLRLLHWRVVLQEGAAERPERRTTGYELLADLLEQKEALATERLFRALGLAYRDENLAAIYEGLRSPDAATRASSRELLHGLLRAGLREAIAGLADEAPDRERLAAGVAYYAPEPFGYDALVLALATERSVTVSGLAAYHAEELGLAGVPEPSEARAADREEWVSRLRRRPLDAEPPPGVPSGVVSA